MKFLFDAHTHTIASGHAYNTLYEMIQRGADIGYSVSHRGADCLSVLHDHGWKYPDRKGTDRWKSADIFWGERKLSGAGGRESDPFYAAGSTSG